jgi:hypothetical protein
MNDDIPDFLVDDDAEAGERWPLALLGIALAMAIALALL